MTTVGMLMGESRTLSRLFDAPSMIWSLGVSLLQPLFTAGRLKANEDFATAGYDATVASYRRVPFHGLYLVADLAIRVSRVGKRVHDASDADASIARRQEDYDIGPLDWTKVDASGTPDETLGRARKALA